MKKIQLIYMTILGLLLALFTSYGSQQLVVTLGNDLNQQQRQQMLDLFKVDEGTTRILVVTNEEERRYLEGVATEKQIGNRAISSAFVENLQQGEGMSVDTYNINWVTKEMIMNALVTAGVNDAMVIAAAPFEVSGTAALTGILKAFEELRGEAIDEEQKRIANKEIVTTGELGEDIGREQATKLIREIKQIIIEKQIKEPEEIKKIIIEISGELNINLSEKQLEDITNLMQQITKLNIDTDAIRQQLEGMGEQLRNISRDNQEVKSLLGRIIDMLRSLIESILGLFSR
jgi:uncharacterized protein YpuA (DUF1002 family)